MIRPQRSRSGYTGIQFSVPHPPMKQLRSNNIRELAIVNTEQPKRMAPVGLRRLLVIHGFVTLAAAIVLAVAPGVIPRTVGIHLAPQAYLMAYLLAGAEFGLATLSFAGSRLTDPQGLRVIVWSCIAFHASSGILELYAYMQGVSAAILGNLVARGGIILLFAWLSKKLPASFSGPN
jgi:hypothetical protein